ncbi:MAG: HEPN domain-containing protein [Anaerolineales bacterium]|jgi:HEPN domain-containing protein|nr:HEPN domain-containing protein [Anaerolineales bacterium]
MHPLATEWVLKAEGDYVTARRERYARRAPNHDAACFHSQQMAEKYMKAFLQEHGLLVPRTHDLVELLSLCQPLEPTFALIELDLKGLNGYAISVRYPGQISGKEEAVQAVRQADIVRRFIRERLNLPV